jgi:hypothetical protein
MTISEESQAVPEDEAVEVPPEVGDEKAQPQASKNLLDRLLYQGVLPRYAFPTDVASFFVFDENRSQYARPAFRFSPSQGLNVALSQYAPGKEVWIANKRFTSGAIYSPIRSERFDAWQSKRLYYECRNCHYACTRSVTEGQKGEVGDCPACGKERAFGEARFWFRPPGFAHPISVAEDVTPDDAAARSYATRAKLDAPTPDARVNSWVQVTPHVRTHYLREQLLVTNTGPRQEGYTYCTQCGMIEPTASQTGNLFKAHSKPYPDSKNQVCPGGRASVGVCLGTDFITDILLISLKVEQPVRLTPGSLATEIALRTASEAVAKAAALTLGLEEGEVQADYRAALTGDGQSGMEAEIYLYDTLPGGAGFARAVGDQTVGVLGAALNILNDCDCDSSCYKCLRSFKNKFEHHKLDRHLGYALLSYVHTGVLPAMDEERVRQSLTVLGEDVLRQLGTAVVELDSPFAVDGIGEINAPLLIRANGNTVVVAISHPLAAQSAPTVQLQQLAEFSSVPLILIHELRIRRSLPSATNEVLIAVGHQS